METYANQSEPELGGPIGKTTVEIVEGELSVELPVYPAVVARFVREDPKDHEGYLIQEVPGGFRFIAIDFPDWEVGEDGEEYQLPAIAEFGPVESTKELAIQTAYDHYCEFWLDHTIDHQTDWGHDLQDAAYAEDSDWDR